MSLLPHQQPEAPRDGRIDVVLFDADGVIQSTPRDWLSQWEEFAGSADDTTAFLDDIFAAETPHLTGQLGLKRSIQAVLDRWGSDAPLDRVMTMWEQVLPSAETLDIANAVRRSGCGTGLATNQHAFRWQFMQRAFGYADRFDHFFVSCNEGISKPHTGFFDQAIHKLAKDPDAILFIDDSSRNVESARSVGMRAEVFHLSEGSDRLRHLLNHHGIQL